LTRDKLADAGAELLEGVESVDPEDLLLERLQEFRDDAVGFGLVDERLVSARDQVVDLGLVLA
jgi:hypothetical protein